MSKLNEALENADIYDTKYKKTYLKIYQATEYIAGDKIYHNLNWFSMHDMSTQYGYSFMFLIYHLLTLAC